MLKHMPPGAAPSTAPSGRHQQPVPPVPPVPGASASPAAARAAAAAGNANGAPPIGPSAAPRTSLNSSNVAAVAAAANNNNHNNINNINSSNSTVSNGSIIFQQQQQPPPLPSGARPSGGGGGGAQLQPLNVSTISSSTSPHSILHGPAGGGGGGGVGQTAASSNAGVPNKQLLLLANGNGPTPSSAASSTRAMVGTSATHGPHAAQQHQLQQQQQQQHQQLQQQQLLHMHHSSHHALHMVGCGGVGNGGCGSSSTAMLNTTPLTSVSSSLVAGNSAMSGVGGPIMPAHICGCMAALSTKHRVGAREALTSLGLLCLVSLLLALLSLIFLLKISPGGREPPPPPPGPISSEDYIIVYDVTLALCALSLSLNLCCLLVCAIQFLFAVKLVRAPATSGRGNKYLQKSSVSRVCAVGGFFISIPIFLTGIILYTFTQFHSTPAIITSVLIGFGIVFCGCAMVHNVFVWQKEKTICVRHQNQSHMPLNLSLHAPTAAAQSTATGHAGQSAMPPGIGISTISAGGAQQLYLNHNGHAGGAGGLHAPLQPITMLGGHQLAHNMNHAAGHIAHTTPVPVTPLSPNHSHVSFGGNNGAHNNSAYVPTYGVRPATATPPTPKMMMGNGTAAAASVQPTATTTATATTTSTGMGRDACGSVSPGMMAANGSTLLELSNASGPGSSPHELSTLV